MNRIERLTAMILMLQSERVITAAQIAAHFEISERTVYRDIVALGEAGVPIAAEAGIGYSLMHGFHMPPVMFTEEEAAALFLSAELASQSSDISLKKALQGAMLKIRGALPAERRDYLRRLGGSVRIWEPSSAEHTKTSSLMPIQEAIVRRRCLKLHYNSGGLGTISERVVEPLGVVFYGKHWHLIGWCHLRNALRDFRLDRMKKCEALSKTFEGHQEFSLMDFLDSETDAGELSPATIMCKTWALDRVLAEIPAQVVKQTILPDGITQVDALAYCYDWLARWLLGLGTGVTVHSPDELREKLSGAALEIAAQYKKHS